MKNALPRIRRLVPLSILGTIALLTTGCFPGQEIRIQAMFPVTWKRPAQELPVFPFDQGPCPPVLQFNPKVITAGRFAPAQGGNRLSCWDGPDPDIVQDPETGRVYVFTTTAHWRQVQMFERRPRVGWVPLNPDALAFVPSWATEGFFWAPHVTRLDRSPDPWSLFFTSYVRDTSKLCIGQARAAKITGPYVPDPQPFFCEQGQVNALDPFVVRDGDGNRFFYWAIYGPGVKNQIRSIRMHRDGSGLYGPRTVAMQASLPWEEGVVENPSVVWHPTVGWLMTYSGSYWDTPRYGFGFAVCQTAMGPCHQRIGPVVNGPSTGVPGPGGSSLAWIAQPDGTARLTMVWHAWNSPNTSYAAGARRQPYIGVLAP